MTDVKPTSEAQTMTKPAITAPPLTVKEAAALLGIGRKRLTAAIRSGQIHAQLLGRRYLVPVIEVERLTTGPRN